jgi:hypothetical protein
MSDKTQNHKIIIGFVGSLGLIVAWRFVAHSKDFITNPWENILYGMLGGVCAATILYWYEKYGANYSIRRQKQIVFLMFVFFTATIVILLSLLPN